MNARWATPALWPGARPWRRFGTCSDQEPRRPSVFNPEVDRDLETICLKCLEKEPERRYGSAEALAEDLERWLRCEPILARPASAWEKTGKWVRRKPALAGRSPRVGVAAGGCCRRTPFPLADQPRSSNGPRSRLSRAPEFLRLGYDGGQRALKKVIFGRARKLLLSHVPAPVNRTCAGSSGAILGAMPWGRGSHDHRERRQ
jgi:hypothetical protein